MPTEFLKFLDASLVDLERLSNGETFALHFVTKQEGKVAVTLPKSQVQRLAQHIAAELGHE